MDNKKLQVDALAKAGDFKFRKRETDVQTDQPQKEKTEK